ncbi:MAG: hypothetical protein CUN55_01175 [Phototrophicales bacterium]|nr:MAG: hypothetical protein CUN55_01175 [Phototrophicales bacterium]
MSDLRQALNELRQQIEMMPAEPSATLVADLEALARNLLTQSKNTPFEAEARELFSQLAQRSAIPATNPNVGQVRSLIRKARIRIEIAGDDRDLDEAIDILAEALALDPENIEIHELLHQAAQRSAQHMLKVQGLATRYGFTLSEDTTSDSASDPTTSTNTTSIDATNEAELLNEIASTYYAGDYERTIELAEQLPQSEQAQEFKQKAEDNLMRGIVPDHRIPFDARVAYNRANSLVRAGNYEEAERLYREAREIAERSGIRSWKDVEQALLEIQDLVLARQLLADGDRLLAADEWSEALSKYEGSLRVVPNNPEAEERIKLVKRIQEQYDQANIRLSTISGSLMERADGLVNLLTVLSNLRQVLPGSARLQQMVNDTNAHLQNVKAQLIDQGQATLSRIEGVSSLEDKYRLAEESLELFTMATRLDPTDSEAIAGKRQAEQLVTELREGRQIIERASGLIAQNFDNELAQARQMLSGLRHFAQDPRYQNLVGELLGRHIERVELALDRRDIEAAARWLAICKEEPFRVLGRRTEILRLENELRALRQRRFLSWGAAGIILLMILAAIGYINRTPILGVIAPSDTPSPTGTMTFTATATATATDTPSPTSTPSDTPTATATSTPTNTPLSPEEQTATAFALATSTAQTLAAINTATQEEINLANQRATEQRAIDLTATRDAFLSQQTSTAAVRTQIASQTFAAATGFFVQTQQAQATLTATNRPPTSTPTPTRTFTPTATATPRTYICQVFTSSVGGVNIRETPNGTVIGTFFPNERGDVYEQQRDRNGVVWYFIELTRDGELIQGWVADTVVGEFDPPCPPVD